MLIMNKIIYTYFQLHSYLHPPSVFQWIQLYVQDFSVKKINAQFITGKIIKIQTLISREALENRLTRSASVYPNHFISFLTKNFKVTLFWPIKSLVCLFLGFDYGDFFHFFSSTSGRFLTIRLILSNIYLWGIHLGQILTFSHIWKVTLSRPLSFTSAPKYMLLQYP